MAENLPLTPYMKNIVDALRSSTVGEVRLVEDNNVLLVVEAEISCLLFVFHDRETKAGMKDCS